MWATDSNKEPTGTSHAASTPHRLPYPTGLPCLNSIHPQLDSELGIMPRSRKYIFDINRPMRPFHNPLYAMIWTSKCRVEVCPVMSLSH